MKLVSYLRDGHDYLAVLVNGLLYDMEYIHPDLPTNMSLFLQYWEDAFPVVQNGVQMIEEVKIARGKGFPVDSVEIVLVNGRRLVVPVDMDPQALARLLPVIDDR